MERGFKIKYLIILFFFSTVCNFTRASCSCSLQGWRLLYLWWWVLLPCLHPLLFWDCFVQVVIKRHKKLIKGPVGCYLCIDPHIFPLPFAAVLVFARCVPLVFPSLLPFFHLPHHTELWCAWPIIKLSVLYGSAHHCVCGEASDVWRFVFGWTCIAGQGGWVWETTFKAKETNADLSFEAKSRWSSSQNQIWQRRFWEAVFFPVAQFEASPRNNGSSPHSSTMSCILLPLLATAGRRNPKGRPWRHVANTKRAPVVAVGKVWCSTRRTKSVFSLPSAPPDHYRRGASCSRIAAGEARNNRCWWQKLHTLQSPPGPWWGGCGECLVLPWWRLIKLVKDWEGEQHGKMTWLCPSSHGGFLITPTLLSLGIVGENGWKIIRV